MGVGGGGLGGAASVEPGSGGGQWRTKPGGGRGGR